VCSPIRAAYEWRRAELAKQGQVVTARDGVPLDDWCPDAPPDTLRVTATCASRRS